MGYVLVIYWRNQKVVVLSYSEYEMRLWHLQKI